jgi:ribosomal-protein-alanine N-acetyltransferase
MIIVAEKSWSNGTVELFALGPQDATESYVHWLNDPATNRYLESRFTRHTVASARAYVDNCMHSDTTVFLGVRDHTLGGLHVGNVKVEINRDHGVGELGILIGEEKARGRGLATQVIKMVTGIARTQLKLRKLSAGCYVSNKGSERAFVAAGFVVEGIRPEHFLLDGRPEDLVLLGLVL